ncbi:glutathione S-transferase family protein [Sphingomonas bacterium]|uniref:glutathione S-transferase family protein n=1 Tax=Sphingomonas bacterium TaxID=1895847 RepID=UPI00157680DB|nr:glutathione S-transferase family protein [Sphingomonas bacterium]
MIIYGSGLSPFVRKVLFFAHEKGIAVDLRMAGMGAGGEDFAAASPFRKMPALRDPGADGGRDFTISDSSAIVTYIEAKFPDPALIPSDPISRARTIWWDEFGDTLLMKACAPVFFNRVVAPRFLKRPGDMAAADAAVRDELPPLFDYLERTIPDTGFLVDDRLTLADISVVCPLVNLEYCDVAMDPVRWPRTIAYRDAILGRPGIADLVAGERRLMAA